MQSETAYEKAREHDEYHPERHITGTGEHIGKYLIDAVCIKTVEFASQHFENVCRHPSADGSIKHHEQVVAGHAGIALEMPFASFWLQDMERAGC